MTRPRSVLLPLAVTLWSACSSSSPQVESARPSTQPTALSVAANTPILAVFNPFGYEREAAAYYVIAGETVDNLPADAPLHTVQTGPPPCGPIAHMMDIIELSDAPAPQTFTILPHKGEPACVQTSRKRAALAHRQVFASSQNEVARPTSGREAFVMERDCPFSSIALGGAHPRARGVLIHESHRITAEDIGVLADISDVFDPSDIARLAAAPKGAVLSRIGPEKEDEDVALYVSVLWSDTLVQPKRIWRDGELLLETDEPIVGFILDGDASRAFVLTSPARLIGPL